MRRTTAGTLMGAALSACDKPPPPSGGAASTLSAQATDGPDQVVLSVPGMT